MAENEQISSTPETPIWRTRWFGHLLTALLVLAVIGLVLPPLLAVMYAVRPVLLPVLIGVGLAYAADPLARWAKRRLRIPRPASALTLMTAIGLILLGLLIYLVPKLIAQVYDLIRNLPTYLEQLAAQLHIDVSELVIQLEQMAGLAPAQVGPEGAPLDVGAASATVAGWLGVGIGVIGSTIGYATYVALAIVVICFCFFFFMWKFDRISAWFVPFIPASRREHAIVVLRKMDVSVSGFIRGRLIQATVVAVVLSVGWSPLFADVPYWLLLGVGSGFLNLIPYAAVVGWPLAVGLAWLDTVTTGGSTFNVWHVVVWPSVVYIFAQSLDGWVVEPLVQGKATNLDPLTVLLVVLVGGSLAGLLGLLIAIPAAACAKILAQEVLLPRLRAWAAVR